MTLPTICVVNDQDEPKVINQADFDPELHTTWAEHEATLAGANAAASGNGSVDVTVTREDLEARAKLLGVEYRANIGDESLSERNDAKRADLEDLAAGANIDSPAELSDADLVAALTQAEALTSGALNGLT